MIAMEKNIMEYFQNSLDESPRDLLSKVIEDKVEVFQLLSDDAKKLSNMTTFLELINKACDVSKRQQLANFFINFSNDHLNAQLQKFLLSLTSENLSKDSIPFFKHLQDFILCFQNTLPTQATTFFMALSPILNLSLTKFKDKFPTEVEGICNSFEAMEKNKFHMLENVSDRDIFKMSKNEKLHSYEPPNDFRDISIFPTEDDMLNLKPFLRPNVAKGKFHDEEHYLDVQFRLLREDFILPLREGINEYRAFKGEAKNKVNYVKDLRVYRNVRIIKAVSTISGMIHIIQFNIKPLKHINWENSKRLIHGSLVCLSNNNFETTIFATVVKNEPKAIKHGVCELQFKNLTEDILADFLSQSYTMLESQAFFEAYRHTLQQLQTITPATFPFKEYIVDVKSCSIPPSYVKIKRRFNFNSISVNRELEDFKKELKEFEEETSKELLGEFLMRDVEDPKLFILEKDKWPPKEDMGLDEAQYLALQGALTNEFSIIQGPPGTGKTFLGLKIVKFLLDNKIFPILIVCYTNHALDQFLEGILKFNDSVIRFGGRSKNEQLEKYQISTLRLKNKESAVRRTMSKLKYMEVTIERLKRNIKRAQTSIMDINDLQYFMFDHHCSLFESKNESFEFTHESSDPNLSQFEFTKWLEMDQLVLAANERVKQDNKKIQKTDDEFDREFEVSRRETDMRDYSHDFNLDDYITQEEIVENPFAVFIMSLIKQGLCMTLEEEQTVNNVWRLHPKRKWRLYALWIEQYLNENNYELEKLQSSYLELSERLVELKQQEDLGIARGVQIIGLTTTGAAKNAHILNGTQPKVVVVEEAAEVLEAHILTSLNETVQQLILIGDHQQLRPAPTVYQLAKKFDLDVSLFERMINNGFSYHTLEQQHRMRPCISQLLVPHIYPHLRNHASVEAFDNIRGMAKNMFFVTHEHNEEPNEDSKSYSNVYEARFIFEMCKYLLKQGYDPPQITILTAYTGQMFAIKKLLKSHNKAQKVRTTVVDNFQGEENEIILVSFVRSNPDEIVGFLKISNRVCVALSRARKGLYCVGNFELFAKCSPVWTQIVSYLENEKFIGKKLLLQCANHQDTFTDVIQPSDFRTIPDGGCSLLCQTRLDCGHSCTRYCHPDDPEHLEFRCEKLCEKQLKTCHKCIDPCYVNCEPCKIIVSKVLPFCQHTLDLPCYQKVEEIKCEQSCSKILKCGHQCQNTCRQSCEPCEVIVKKAIPNSGQSFLSKLNCGHLIDIACWKIPTRRDCPFPCEDVLACTHPCKLKCSDSKCECKEIISVLSPCNHMVDIKCDERCTISKENLLNYCKGSCKVELSCGHTNTIKCRNKNRENNCYQLCDLKISCGHTIEISCNKKSTLSAKELLKFCNGFCEQKLSCGHTCSGLCSTCTTRFHVPCKAPCGELLICGHVCPKLCSEICSPCKENKCLYKCFHGACPKNCFEVCSPCLQNCEWKCEHYKCSKLCHEICDRPPCNSHCIKTLKCGHECMGYCGEPCPDLCGTCDKMELEKLFFGVELDENDRFVTLEDCNHVFECEGLERLLNRSYNKRLQLKTCPQCRAPIFKNFRFGNILKNNVKEIQLFKAQYFDIEELNLLKDELESTIVYLKCRYSLDEKTRSIMRAFNLILQHENYELIDKSYLVLLITLVNIFEDVIKHKITGGPLSGNTINIRLQKLSDLYKEYRLMILDGIEGNIGEPGLDKIQNLALERNRFILIVKAFYKLKENNITDASEALLNQLKIQTPFTSMAYEKAQKLFDALPEVEVKKSAETSRIRNYKPQFQERHSRPSFHQRTIISDDDDDFF